MLIFLTCYMRLIFLKIICISFYTSMSRSKVVILKTSQLSLKKITKEEFIAMTKNNAKTKVIMVKCIRGVPEVPVIHESNITSPVNVLKPLSIQAKMQQKRKKATRADTNLVADMQQRLKTIVKSDNLAARMQQKMKAIAETTSNKPEEATEIPVGKCNIKIDELAQETEESKFEITTERREYPNKRNLHKHLGEEQKYQTQSIKSESVDDYLESIQKLQSALDGSDNTAQ